MSNQFYGSLVRIWDVNRDWKIMAWNRGPLPLSKPKLRSESLSPTFNGMASGDYWTVWFLQLGSSENESKPLSQSNEDTMCFKAKQYLVGNLLKCCVLVESGHHRSMPPGGSSLSHRWMCKKTIWIHCVMSMWIMWFSRSNVICHITIRESFKSMCLSCAYRTIDFSCTILRLPQLLSLPIDCTKEHSENKNCDPPLSEFKDI